jgi:hypothetical protein
VAAGEGLEELTTSLTLGWESKILWYIRSHHLMLYIVVDTLCVGVIFHVRGNLLNPPVQWEGGSYRVGRVPTKNSGVTNGGSTHPYFHGENRQTEIRKRRSSQRHTQ